MNKKDLQKKYNINDKCLLNKTVVKEKESEFRIEPKSPNDEIFCIKVDDCHIQDKNTVKCDYVFHRNISTAKQGELIGKFYFVELKGSDFKKAFEQIKETISKHFQTQRKETIGFIVTSRTLPQNNPEIANAKEEFRKKYGLALHHKNRVLKFDPIKETVS